MSKLTPIEVELLRNGLTSICDEMFLAIMKSAYSTNIKERHDHSAAIFDAQGRVVVQGESLPLHLASMLGLVEVVLDRYGVEEINPGDMFLSNDPFVGRGSHLPDVAILAPIFRDGELVLFVSNIAHHSDIGGMAPGSMAGGMTEIYQEGLRIPPIRIVQEDKILQDVFDLVLLNVRVPNERRGDYMAQIAANRLGNRRLTELFKKWSKKEIEKLTSTISTNTKKSFGDTLNKSRVITKVPDKELQKLIPKGDKLTFGNKLVDQGLKTGKQGMKKLNLFTKLSRRLGTKGKVGLALAGAALAYQAFKPNKTKTKTKTPGGGGVPIPVNPSDFKMVPAPLKLGTKTTKLPLDQRSSTQNKVNRFVGNTVLSKRPS